MSEGTLPTPLTPPALWSPCHLYQVEEGERDHGPSRADSFHFWAGSLGLQEAGRRKKDLTRMRSSRKEVRLGRRMGVGRGAKRDAHLGEEYLLHQRLMKHKTKKNKE